MQKTPRGLTATWSTHSRRHYDVQVYVGKMGEWEMWKVLNTMKKGKPGEIKVENSRT